MSSMSKNNSDSWFSRIIEGRLVTGDFFARHWMQIFVIIAMVLVYITNRYSCQRAMEQIRTLNNRLDVVQTESYRVRGEYMGRIRESELSQSLDSLGLGLAVQQRPPYHLSLTGKTHDSEVEKQ